MKRIWKIAALALSLSLVLAVLTACGCGSDKKKKTTTKAEPPAPEMLVIVGENGACEYTVVSPKKSNFQQGLTGVATGLRTYLRETLGATAIGITNDSAAPTEKELLVGDTERAETEAVRARLAETASEAYFRYVVAEMNGKVVLYGECDEACTFIYDYFIRNYVDLEAKTLTIAKNTFDVQTMTWVAYAEYVEQKRIEEEAAKEEQAAQYLTSLKEKLRSLGSVSDFGGIQPIETPSAWLALDFAYPQAGAHPRVLVNQSTLAALKQNAKDVENRFAMQSYQRYLTLSDKAFNLGVLGTSAYNYDETVLGSIEARAFDYLLTGNETSGYEAILAIQNFIKTLRSLSGDAYRTYGQIVYVSAKVYDWCYPLMTKADRERMIAGVTTKLCAKMEIGFPPSLQGAVCGHGSECQLLRDYLAFAIACYDEYPELYDYVMGRLQAEYVPVRDYYYQSGAYMQQGNSYGLYRFNFDLIAEKLYETMQKGNSPQKLFAGDLRTVGETFIHNLRPDQTMLRLGDDSLQRGDSYAMSCYQIITFYIAAVTGSPVAKGEAMRFSGNFETGYRYGDQTLTGVEFVIFNDLSLVAEGLSSLPLAIYNGSPVGQTIARSSWTAEDATMLYMKVGEMYTGNHEHKDAGQFQIYYKGILASESGFYEKYSSPVHDNYTKQTISHNSLLIYDPDEDTGEVANVGGQITTSDTEPKTLSAWLSGRQFRRAQVIGHENAVNEDGTMNYAYLAGDLTLAYSATKVDEVLRYMLGVFTDDGSSKMVFFVLDKVSATSSSFQKTFLLHMQSEPVQFDNYSIITASGGGMLVNQTLLPTADRLSINVVEGKYKLYDGTQLELVDRTPEDLTDGLGDEYECSEEGWGKIMIQPEVGQRTDYILNVMYVTDAPEGGAVADASAYAKATAYENDQVIGAVLLGQAAYFSKTPERLDCRFKIAASGEGSIHYMAAGLIAGEWTVCDATGAVVTVVTATEEGGIVSFDAPAGEYTLFAPGEKLSDIPGDGTADDPYVN